MEQAKERTGAPMPEQAAPGDPTTTDANVIGDQAAKAASITGVMPSEPAAALPDAPDPVTAAKQQSEILKALLGFHAHGLRPGGQAGVGDGCWPALLHPYRELTAIRHEFPLCLFPPGEDRPARPLTEIVDEYVDESGPDGDEKERLRRHAYQLEARIGELVSDNRGLSLDVAVENASADLLGASRLSG
jgi:hypothetical protein